MAQMTLEDAQAMITSQREVIENLRKENGELKQRLGEGDIDAQVEAYIKEKQRREKQQREKQATLKKELV